MVEDGLDLLMSGYHQIWKEAQRQAKRGEDGYEVDSGEKSRNGYWLGHML